MSVSVYSPAQVSQRICDENRTRKAALTKMINEKLTKMTRTGGTIMLYNRMSSVDQTLIRELLTDAGWGVTSIKSETDFRNESWTEIVISDPRDTQSFDPSNL